MAIKSVGAIEIRGKDRRNNKVEPNTVTLFADDLGKWDTTPKLRVEYFKSDGTRVVADVALTNVVETSTP